MLPGDGFLGAGDGEFLEDVPWRDPKVGRNRRLRGFLGAAVIVTALAAAAGLILPGRPGQVAAAFAVVVVAAVPIVRVAWLAIRWFSKGDRRFGLVAVALLTVIAVGFLLG
jgi:hypothetical protein